MSLFSFLFGRTAKPAPQQAESVQQHPQERRGQRPDKPASATQWAPALASAPTDPGKGTNAAKSAVEADRVERRDRLYRVVRESLMRCGVLSASYKFKVLSTDARGRQFLVMLEMAAESAGLVRFAQIESLVLRVAKQQHDIDVNAIYWRVNPQLSPKAAEMDAAGREELVSRRAPLSRSASAPLSGSQSDYYSPIDNRATEPASLSGFARLDTRKGSSSAAPGRFDPIAADEVDAFKKALASGGRPSTPADGVVRRFGARAKPSVDFEDTQVFANNNQRAPGLSHTQYGEPI